MPLTDEQFLSLSKEGQKAIATGDSNHAFREEDFLKLPKDMQYEIATGEKAPSEGKSFLDHAGNAAAFGYLPHMVAGAAKAAAPVWDFFTGEHVTEALPAYEKIRDSEIKNLETEAKINPKASIAGDLTGAIGTGVGTGSASFIKGGTSAMARLLRAGAVGGGTGLVMNPGDKEGVIDPIQGKERLTNAALGTALGLGGQGVGEGLSAGANALQNFKKPIVDNTASYIEALNRAGAGIEAPAAAAKAAPSIRESIGDLAKSPTARSLLGAATGLASGKDLEHKLKHAAYGAVAGLGTSAAQAVAPPLVRAAGRVSGSLLDVLSPIASKIVGQPGEVQAAKGLFTKGN